MTRRTLIFSINDNLLKVSLLVFGLLLFELGSLHTIEEGYVGVYFRGGSLLSHVSTPGYHLKDPVLTSVKQVQVTIQTNIVENVSCETSEGIMLNFDRIQVLTELDPKSVIDVVRSYSMDYTKTLINDNVHHELNQFCNRHTTHEIYVEFFDQIDKHLKKALQQYVQQAAPGLRIEAVRITPPKMSNEITQIYKLLEYENTNKIPTRDQEMNYVIRCLFIICLLLHFRKLLYEYSRF